MNTQTSTTGKTSTKFKLQTAGIAGLIIIAAISMITLFSSCDKGPAQRDFPDPIEQTYVEQSFGVQIDSKVTPMGKGWNKDLWVYNYSPTPYTMTLTGTDNSNVYTKQVTVAELKAGTVTISMLAGNYHVTFETPHVQSIDPWSLNGNLLVQLAGREISDVLDIKIDQTSPITGSPLTLTATLQDALIVFNVPTATEVKGFYSDTYAGACARLLKNTAEQYHFGYVNSSKYLDIAFSDGPNKRLPMTTMQLGNCYNIVSPFAAAVVLNIPDMLVQTVVLP